MKRVAALASLLCLAILGRADDLILKGDIHIIEVDRIITTTIKEKRELVKSLPLVVEAPAGAFRPSWIVPQGVVYAPKGRGIEITSAPKGELTIRAEYGIVDFDKKETRDESASKTFLIGDVPKPVPPPPPIPPSPVPVSTFRVILVYESGDTLPANQNAVLYGSVVENFLNATCTGGKAGWRRRDKDNPGDNDPDMAQVWSAVKGEFAPPKNTKTPAVAVQVNSKIEIIPFANSPAEMVAILKKYSEGK